MMDIISKLSRPPVIAGAALAVAALIAIYALKVPGGKDAALSPACRGAAEVAARLKPMVHGEVAALLLAARPEPVPSLKFATAEGGTASLEDFRGKTVLLNLWATWCVPCRLEMPALDKLQNLRGSKDFVVVAVNIDTAKLDRPKAFFADNGIKNLVLYTDSRAETFEILKQTGKVFGLPTTILIDKNGCEIGTMAGPAQWDSKDALALIDAIRRG
ncbi:MAG TPA: TlpA disulfide reductase family protein [Methylocella sp.]|nr:TlpA disulfide reductase family protein [Methylocella sp.]